MSSELLLQVSELEYHAKIKENDDLRQRIDALKQQVRGLKRKCTALEKWKNEHAAMKQNTKQQVQNDNNSDDTMVSMEQVKQFLAEYGGLGRYTIVDDDWHSKHPKAANHLLGFKTWDEGKQIMKMHFPDLIQAAPKLYLSRNSKRWQIETGTTLFERCVAVKLMERLGLAASKCGSIYSADERTVKSWRSDWQKRWGIDEIKVFQCPPLLGPSAVKKRKRMNEMAASEMAVHPGEERDPSSTQYLTTVAPPMDPAGYSQQQPPLLHGHHAIGNDEFLREALHNNNINREERHEEAARAPYMVHPEAMQQPPLAAAVAAFIRNNNHHHNFHPPHPYRGPYEPGGYYL